MILCNLLYDVSIALVTGLVSAIIYSGIAKLNHKKNLSINFKKFEGQYQKIKDGQEEKNRLGIALKVELKYMGGTEFSGIADYGYGGVKDDLGKAEIKLFFDETTKHNAKGVYQYQNTLYPDAGYYDVYVGSESNEIRLYVSWRRSIPYDSKAAGHEIWQKIKS